MIRHVYFSLLLKNMHESTHQNNNAPNGVKKNAFLAPQKQIRHDWMNATIREEDPFQHQPTESLEESGARLRDVIVRNNDRLHHIGSAYARDASTTQRIEAATARNQARFAKSLKEMTASTERTKTDPYGEIRHREVLKSQEEAAREERRAAFARRAEEARLRNQARFGQALKNLTTRNEHTQTDLYGELRYNEARAQEMAKRAEHTYEDNDVAISLEDDVFVDPEDVNVYPRAFSEEKTVSLPPEPSREGFRADQREDDDVVVTIDGETLIDPDEDVLGPIQTEQKKEAQAIRPRNPDTLSSDAREMFEHVARRREQDAQEHESSQKIIIDKSLGRDFSLQEQLAQKNAEMRLLEEGDPSLGIPGFHALYGVGISDIQNRTRSFGLWKRVLSGLNIISGNRERSAKAMIEKYNTLKSEAEKISQQISDADTLAFHTRLEAEEQARRDYLKTEGARREQDHINALTRRSSSARNPSPTTRATNRISSWFQKG